MTTPPLAQPRLPHEVIFAIGGWSEGMPQKFIETYDTRADRWVPMLHEDIAGPRAYHGTAVIGSKIYCIGGFDGMEYFNTCRCFDAVKKTWKEVNYIRNILLWKLFSRDLNESFPRFEFCNFKNIFH
jgi:kelch-like protein 10